MWKWFKAADNVLDVSMRWIAVPGGLTVAFAWLVKKSPFIGSLSWPEAILVGSVAAIVASFLIAFSMAAYRYWQVGGRITDQLQHAGDDDLKKLDGQVRSLSKTIVAHAENLSKIDVELLNRLSQQHSWLADNVHQLRRVVAWLAGPLMAATRLEALGTAPPTNIYPQATPRKSGDPERATGDFEQHFFYIRQYQSEARRALSDLQIPIDEGKLIEEEKKITSNVLHCVVGPSEPFLWVNEEHKQTHLLYTARADAIADAWRKAIADSERAAVLDPATTWEIRELLDPRNNQPV